MTRTPALLLCALALAPLPALAERIAPLAPAQQFDPLAVPMPPQQPAASPPLRVPAPQPPLVPGPGWHDPRRPDDPPQVPAPLRTQAPAAPQIEVTPPAEAGTDMIERGAGIILQNLLTEMQPTFDQMARGLDGAAAKFGPALDQLGGLVDDIGNYQPPERLENGDILIRRRADAPPPPATGALRDLATPPANAPGTTPGTAPTPPATNPPATPNNDDPPALAAPIPSVPPGTQIDL